MYSTTSECLSYLRRVASHATKEHANGRIDAIPYWAAEPTDYFNESMDVSVNDLSIEAKKLKEVLVFIEFLGKRKHVWAKQGMPTDKVPDEEIKQTYRAIRAFWKQINHEIYVRGKAQKAA